MQRDEAEELRRQQLESDQTVAAVVADPGLAATAAGPPSLPMNLALSAGAAIQRGTKLGRFTVLEKLGEGGMGVVVGAYDPELDRRVAIKFLRTRHASADSEGHARLKREAQAMARLRHPNVLSVFEVGEEHGQVFMAMEYVRGTTLAERVEQLRGDGGKSATRWREILALFVAAGRGLEAAHQAGLVHRDFKAANVLCGEDGRVQVTDFGLVGTERDAAPAAKAPAAAPTDETPVFGVGALSGNLLSSELTVPGAVMGTPRYMAPEQHRDSSADPRTDQYSFCLALYEALYGALPFGGETGEQYVANKLTGTLAPARTDAAAAAVPTWLRAALLRGLAVDPAARHPSMTVLLAEIGFDPLVDQEVGRDTRLWLTNAVGLVWLAMPIIAHFIHRGQGRLSWELLLGFDGVNIAGTLAMVLKQRTAFARTDFDRRVAGLVLLSNFCTAPLDAAGWLLGLDPSAIMVLHLFAWTLLTCAFALIADMRFCGTAAYMCALFLLASAWPQYLFLLVLASTFGLVASAALFWRRQPAA